MRASLGACGTASCVVSGVPWDGEGGPPALGMADSLGAKGLGGKTKGALGTVHKDGPAR